MYRMPVRRLLYRKLQLPFPGRELIGTEFQSAAHIIGFDDFAALSFDYGELNVCEEEFNRMENSRGAVAGALWFSYCKKDLVQFRNSTK